MPTDDHRWPDPALWAFGVLLAIAPGCREPAAAPPPAAQPQAKQPPAHAPPDPTSPPATRPGHFEPPDAAARQAAIGPLDTLAAPLRRAFSDGPPFKPIPRPGPGDWLSDHSETPQRYVDYVASKPNRPAPNGRSTLYFLPLGDFDPGRSPPLESLRQVASTYFGLPAQVLPSVSLSDVPAKRRQHHGRLQLRSPDILTWLKGRLPADAYCIIAVTMTDLYPAESWNFVFGQASLSARVGVYSFARYVEDGPDRQAKLMRRSVGVLAHEVGHMFGIGHCTYFSCVMNGSNNLPETDAAPLHLCPLCLRKLHHVAPHSRSVDPVSRYRALANRYDAIGLGDEAGWCRSRAKAIGGDP